MGMTNAAESVLPNAPEDLAFLRRSERPELLRDLKSKLMNIITPLAEENGRLREQLGKLGQTSAPSLSTPSYKTQDLPSFPSLQKEFLGREVHFVNAVFANLRSGILGIITELVQENDEIKKQLVQIKKRQEIAQKPSETMRRQEAPQVKKRQEIAQQPSENFSQPALSVFLGLSQEVLSEARRQLETFDESVTEKYNNLMLGCVELQKKMENVQKERDDAYKKRYNSGADTREYGSKNDIYIEESFKLRDAKFDAKDFHCNNNHYMLAFHQGTAELQKQIDAAPDIDTKSQLTKKKLRRLKHHHDILTVLKHQQAGYYSASVSLTTKTVILRIVRDMYDTEKYLYKLEHDRLKKDKLEEDIIKAKNPQRSSCLIGESVRESDLKILQTNLDDIMPNWTKTGECQLFSMNYYSPFFKTIFGW